jgi:sugar phosphate isomerase/epimerase
MSDNSFNKYELLHCLERREWMKKAAASTLMLAAGSNLSSAERPSDFQLKYMLASPMYGYADLANILPELNKIGAMAIDIWPKVHGNQREQVAEIGEERFATLLEQNKTRLGCITQYPLGPFRLKEEIEFARRFNCQLMVTGGEGPKGLKGNELKLAVRDFIEKMKPHLEFAEANHVTIAIENHANNLIESADSLRYLHEFRPNKNLAIALAPYHLPQDPQQLAHLIRDLGDGIAMFYAWQHGAGCMQAQPKDKELLQMPGRGDLDFGPLIEALRSINYTGWTEIFMHPFPRGIPILETTDQVTTEINRARKYLDDLSNSR